MGYEKKMFATFLHKFLIASGAVLFFTAGLAGVWLWSLGHMPVLFSITFILFSIFFGIRFYAVIRNPVVIIQDSTVRFLGWSGGYREIDTQREMDIAIGLGKIFIKQGRTGVGVSKDHVSKTHYDELVNLFKKSNVN